jgi:MFS transporter, FHS family, Na+ dependent glucose transporter 1
VLGVVLGMLGPALPSLRAQVGASVSGISFVFVAQSAGYLVGAVAGGRGLDRGHGHRLLAGALVLMAGGLLLVEQSTSLVAMCGAFVVLGLAIGFVEVGSNTLLVWARSPTSASMINALHFVFGVGALLSPLLVNRSLSARGNVRLAYAVAAIATVLAVAIVSRCSTPRPVDVAEHARGEVAPRRLLVAVAVFFALYVGIEVGFAGWIATYAESVGLGSGSGSGAGAALTAVFWAAFTAGRLGSVAIATRVRPIALLVGACGVSALAGVALVAARGSGAPVWVATVLFAFGLAPQFASMIAFASEHLPLTGSATSWFLAAAAIGGLTVPWLIGQLLSGVGTGALPAVALVGAVVTLAWVLVLDRVLPPSHADVEPRGVAVGDAAVHGGQLAAPSVAEDTVGRE